MTQANGNGTPDFERTSSFIQAVRERIGSVVVCQDVVVERAVLDLMKNAQYRRAIRIVNGLVPGNLTRALNGEAVGTLITAE